MSGRAKYMAELEADTLSSADHLSLQNAMMAAKEYALGEYKSIGKDDKPRAFCAPQSRLFQCKGK